jgi:hypothetical protein
MARVARPGMNRTALTRSSASIGPFTPQLKCSCQLNSSLDVTRTISTHLGLSAALTGDSPSLRRPFAYNITHVRCSFIRSRLGHLPRAWCQSPVAGYLSCHYAFKDSSSPIVDSSFHMCLREPGPMPSCNAPELNHPAPASAVFSPAFPLMHMRILVPWQFCLVIQMLQLVESQ